MKAQIQVTIVIPTYNSAETLSMVLQSISLQTFPRRKMEVLVIDAGSTDDTLKIAQKFKATVMLNKKQHQVYAKHIGHMKAKGKYIIHLDSDEVLANKKSIAIKVALLEKYPLVKGCVPSGHKTPKDVSEVNNLINDFGDPFSYYMYGFSFNSQFFIKQLKKRFTVVHENKDSVIIDFDHAKALPGLEMSATGMMLDREYLLNEYKALNREPFLISQTFYHLVENNKQVGFIKNDPVVHYSASSWGKYLKKINSRILNNVYKTDMGKSAFSGRLQYYSPWFRLKRLLFIPYSFTLILPIFEGVRLAISRKKVVFLTYPFLCVFISSATLYYIVCKNLGYTPKIKGYGI